MDDKVHPKSSAKKGYPSKYYTNLKVTHLQNSHGIWVKAPYIITLLSTLATFCGTMYWGEHNASLILRSLVYGEHSGCRTCSYISELCFNCDLFLWKETII